MGENELCCGFLVSSRVRGLTLPAHVVINRMGGCGCVGSLTPDEARRLAKAIERGAELAEKKT